MEEAWEQGNEPSDHIIWLAPQMTDSCVIIVLLNGGLMYSHWLSCQQHSGSQATGNAPPDNLAGLHNAM